jgi:hypothetical protein
MTFSPAKTQSSPRKLNRQKHFFCKEKSGRIALANLPLFSLLKASTRGA